MLAPNHELRRFGLKRLAAALGITHGAVSQWRRVPADRVIAVERITGIARGTLRPDLYPHEASHGAGVFDGVPATFSFLEQKGNNIGRFEADT